MSDVTNHGSERVRKRVGVPKKAVNRSVEHALTKGLAHKETTGRLHRYLTKLYHLHQNEHVRVFNNHIYVFKQERLITTLPLPSHLHKIAQSNFTKKNKTKEA